MTAPPDAAASRRTPSGAGSPDDRALAPVPTPPPGGTPPRSASVPPAPVTSARTRFRQVVAAEGRLFLGVLVGVVLLGAPVGLIWRAVSPRIEVLAVAGGEGRLVGVGESPFGADGSFLLITAAVGVLVGFVTVLGLRKDSVGVVLGLAAGGVLAALVARRVGSVVGVPDFRTVLAAARPDTVLDAPLRLRARGVLLAWPVAALVVHLVVSAYTGRPQEPAPPGPPPGSWHGAGRGD